MTQPARLSVGQIQVGRPLAFDVFNAEGHLLLRFGYVIDSAAQLGRLMERGLYREQELEGGALIDDALQGGRPTSVRRRRLPTRLTAFGLLRLVLVDLEAVLTQPDPEFFRGNLLALVTRLQHVCQRDTDAALAGIQLLSEGRYSLRRSLQAAILTELVLKAQQVPSEQRVWVVAAALTANLPILELQDLLYHQDQPLSQAQKQQTHDHPRVAAERLAQLGVSDALWLDVVAQHHETQDGRGYPARLAGDQLRPEALLVGLCDRLIALCSARAHKPATPLSLVLKEMFQARGPGREGELMAQLVKLTGVYPPGTLVRLASGDVAVVFKRSLNVRQPVVKSVRTSSGLVCVEAPRKHLSSEPTYAITGLMAYTAFGHPLNPDTLWADTYDLVPGATDAPSPPSQSGG